MREIRKGDRIKTPRFSSVTIEEVFESEKEAKAAGYTETTHYWDNPDYGINGKSLDMYHMIFAAFKKKGGDIH